MHILVVDDESHILQVIGDFLTDLGHKVKGVHNGVEALREIKEDRVPDLVLSDIRMPVMSGLEFMRAARSSSAARTDIKQLIDEPDQVKR